MSGTLYICGTPIGNLEDISLRALRILKEVDLIAAEDTRDTKKLLSHYGIVSPVASYHQHSREARTKWLLDQLRAGKRIAFVTSAGTPTVSDPGADLVRQCDAAGIAVVPIPGPSAVVAALSASGLDAQRFLFAGFLPRKKGPRRRSLEDLRTRRETLIFFESPERVLHLLRDALDVLGDRYAVLGREVTKRFEEFCRGRLGELVRQMEARPPRGEFTLAIEGAPENLTQPADESQKLEHAQQLFHSLVAKGESRRVALRSAAQKAGVPRNVLYDRLLAAVRR